MSEWCCNASLLEAKQKAWYSRDTSCGCDHAEYCETCYPLDFRPGGNWHTYREPEAGAELRWVIGEDVYGRPTADDLRRALAALTGKP